jgi:hypothetical protein
MPLKQKIMTTLSIVFTALPQLFLEGGPIGMSILTVILVGLLFAAWKAPAWVRGIGAAGLAFSFLMVAISWYKAATAVEICQGEISPALLWGGLKCCTVTIIYGLIIYLVSWIIHIIRTPRL